MVTAPDISAIQGVYKGILLDLDNTLYEYDVCHKYALQKTSELYNQLTQNTDFDSFVAFYQKGREATKENNKGTVGSRSRHLYFQRMFEIGSGATNIKNSLLLGDAYWEAFIEKMVPHPWVQGFLESARTSGIKIAVVTNLESSIQYRKLIHLGVDTLIDFIVTSEEAGVEKPDSKVFALALDKLSLKPSEVVVIGDDQAIDGVGASQVGMAFMICG